MQQGLKIANERVYVIVNSIKEKLNEDAIGF